MQKQGGYKDTICSQVSISYVTETQDKRNTLIYPDQLQFALNDSSQTSQVNWRTKRTIYPASHNKSQTAHGTRKQSGPDVHCLWCSFRAQQISGNRGTVQSIFFFFFYLDKGHESCHLVTSYSVTISKGLGAVKRQKSIRHPLTISSKWKWYFVEPNFNQPNFNQCNRRK